jgi:hypothetical protein
MKLYVKNLIGTYNMLVNKYDKPRPDFGDIKPYFSLYEEPGNSFEVIVIWTDPNQGNQITLIFIPIQANKTNVIMDSSDTFRTFFPNETEWFGFGPTIRQSLPFTCNDTVMHPNLVLGIQASDVSSGNYNTTSTNAANVVYQNDQNQAVPTISQTQTTVQIINQTQTTTIQGGENSVANELISTIEQIIAGIVAIIVATLILRYFNKRRKKKIEGRKDDKKRIGDLASKPGPAQTSEPVVVSQDSYQLSRDFAVFVAYDDMTGFDIAEHLKLALEKRNISTFVARLDITEYVKLNREWRETIDLVIATCDTFILIMSTDLLSDEVRREIMSAIDRNKVDAKLSIIIARMKGIPRTSLRLTDLGIDLSNYQQIDFSSAHDLARKISLRLDGHGRATKVIHETQPSDDPQKQVASVLRRMKTRWKIYVGNPQNVKWSAESINLIKTEFGEDAEELLTLLSENPNAFDPAVNRDLRTVLERIGLFRSFAINFGLPANENFGNFSDLEEKGKQIFSILNPLLATLENTQRKEDPGQLSYRAQQLTKPLQDIHSKLARGPALIPEALPIFEREIEDRGLLSMLEKDSPDLIELIKRMKAIIEEVQRSPLDPSECVIEGLRGYDAVLRIRLSQDEKAQELTKNVQKQIGELIAKYGGL